jgi:nucleotide-binding universal stress UspA family protein
MHGPGILTDAKVRERKKRRDMMYEKIMVPLDGSELAECVLSHVEAIAKGCGTREVVFVRAVEPVTLPIGTVGDGPVITEADAEKTRKEIDARAKVNARDYLAQVAKRVKLGSSKVQTAVITGKVAESLAEYATKNNADLIVIATHGRSGISRWVWGSVADRLLRSACVPVLMVRAPGCITGI